MLNGRTLGHGLFWAESSDLLHLGVYMGMCVISVWVLLRANTVYANYNHQTNPKGLPIFLAPSLHVVTVLGQTACDVVFTLQKGSDMQGSTADVES